MKKTSKNKIASAVYLNISMPDIMESVSAVKCLTRLSDASCQRQRLTSFFSCVLCYFSPMKPVFTPWLLINWPWKSVAKPDTFGWFSSVINLLFFSVLFIFIKIRMFLLYNITFWLIILISKNGICSASKHVIFVVVAFFYLFSL